MNRPKKEFIPTTLSDLNIDSISIGSNGDRHNNNSNGARVNNFDRFKATSSSNLSYKHSNLNNNNNNNNNIASNNNSSKRSSKLYSSQSNLSTTSSTGSRYQAVVHSNNYNTNTSKATASGDMDKWMQAWEDTNNNFRAPSYHSNAQHHQQQQQHSKMFNKINHENYKRSNSNNFNSNMQAAAVVVEDPFDPFEDPWSGIFDFPIFFSHLFSIILHIFCSICTLAQFAQVCVSSPSGSIFIRLCLLIFIFA